MKFFVNENCIGCEYCATTCLKVFKMIDEKSVAVAIDEEVVGELLDSANEVMENCPASAIEHKN